MKSVHLSSISHAVLFVQDLLLGLPHGSSGSDSHTLVLSVRARGDHRGPSGVGGQVGSERRSVGVAAGPEGSL